MKKKTAFLVCLVLIMLVSLTMTACHKNNVPDDVPPDDGTKTYPTVVFNFNDGTGKTQSVKMTTSAKIPTATREGYRFLGWSKTSDGKNIVENVKNLADGTEVFAAWEVKVFRVNFTVNNEIVAYDNVEYGKAATAPALETFADKIPSGKVFAGWDKDFDEVKSVLQVNAVLNDMQSFTVSFYKESTDSAPYEVKTGTAEDVVPSVKNPELSGFKFEGWFDGDGNEYVAGKRFEKDATYYAKWSVAKPNAATAKPISLIYGESKTISATPASNNVASITYTYAWYLEGRKIADGLTAEISGLVAGKYTLTVKVTASYEGRGESSAESEVTVIVQKAVLTATISSVNLVYGDAFTSTTIAFSGFKGADDESVIKGEKQFLTEYKQGSDAGKYSLSVKVGDDGLRADNYDIEVIGGFVEVSRKNLSANISGVSKVFDGTPLSYCGSALADDLAEGDVLTVEFKTDSPNAGEYFYRGGADDNVTVLSVKVERDGKDVSKNYEVTLTVSASIGLADIEYAPVENVETTFDGAEHFSALELNGFNVTYSTDGVNFKSAIPTFVHAGEYTVYYRIEKNGYATVNDSFTVTIKKLAVSLKAKDAVVTYGNAAPVLSYEFVGEALSNELAALLYEEAFPALSTDYVKGDGVGEKTIFMAEVHSENFDVSVQNGKIEIRPRSATVKADDKTVTYGETANLTATISGLLDGDSAMATPTSDKNVAGTPVGEYEISVSAEHPNYVFTTESGTLTVVPKNITVKIANSTVRYGDDFDIAAQSFAVISGEIFGSDELNVVYSSSYRVGTNAGETAEISAIVGNENYSATVQNGTLIVVKRAVSVKATAKTVIYGDAAPETYGFDVLSGSIYGTDDLGLTFAANTYFAGAGIGAYDVTGTATNDNYVVTVEKGTLSVTARKITVKAADAAVEYGSAAPSLGYGLVSGEIFGTDNLGFATKTSYAAGDKAAEYEVTVEFSENVNYDVTVQSGTLTVTPKEITVSRTAIVAQSGNKWSLVVDGEEISGMVSGDKLYLTLKTSSAADGRYVANGDLSDDFEQPELLKILRGSEDRLASYVVRYDLNVTISTKHITHDAKGYVGAYDGTYHSGTVTVEEGTLTTYSLDGEDFSLTSSPEFTKAGTYTVFFKLQKEGFTETVGKFTVEIQKRAATVKADDKSVTYGDQAPEYTYNQTGILAEDLKALNIAVSSAYTKGANVGLYDISVSYTENDNYEITVTVGTLTVSKKSLDVSPSDVTVSYGEQAAAFEIPAEYASVVRLETDYYQGADVGLYNATAIVLNDNYSITTSSKVVCVQRKATVKAEDNTVEYGKAAPQLKYAVSGLYGTDSAVVSISSDYLVGMAAGTDCEIAISVESNKNYDFTVIFGTLKVEKREVTVSVHNQTVVYGDEFDTTVCGFDHTELFGDDTVSISTYSTDYRAGASAGETFEITATPEESLNYRFTVICGVLTVLKANLKVTVTGPSAITYGDQPTFDFVVTDGLKAGDGKADVGTMTYSSTYFTAPAAGTFKVNGTLDSRNYTAAVTSYDMTVGKATLTLTVAPTMTIPYNMPVPDFDYTAEGFMYDDEAAFTAKFRTDYRKGANVGTYGYNFDESKISLPNYNVVIGADGVLTVEKANIDMSAVTVPSFAGTYFAGITLKNFTLSGGFGWVNENEQVTCNVTKYKATYNPDVQNYNSVTLDVSVVLDKANAEVVANNKEVDWNNAEYIVSEHLGASTTNPETTLVYSFIDLPQNTKVLDGGIYRIRVTSPASTNYNEAHKDVTFTVKAARVDGGSLTTVEEALGRTGTITLAEANGAYAKAFLSAGNYTLASGATLLLAASSDSSTKIGTASYVTENSIDGVNAFVDNDANYIEHKLTILSGANVTVEGSILIQGILGRRGQGLSGHTSNKHSQIENNGTLTFKSGANLDARGYVKGSGSAVFESGSKLYAPFVIHDFRGGTSTVGSYNKGKISPFSRYEMPNVQCNSTIHSGATVTGYCGLWIDNDKEHKTTTAKIIANGSALLNLTSGYIQKSYSNGITALDVFGDINGGSLTMKISVSILSATVDTSAVLFPITYLHKINLHSGTATVKYKYKLLPGAEINIASGATLNLEKGGGLIVYDGSWNDEAGGGVGWFYPNGKGDAKLTVSGNLVVKSGATFGGIVCGEAGGTVSLNSGCTTTMTSSEGYGKSKGDQIWEKLQAVYVETASITKTATLKNADGTTIAGAAGTTYTYNGSSWN